MMTSHSGLYYPFIHFKDDSRLKLSALYWDTMARIVPSSYETEDSDTVKALGDFVVPIPPSEAPYEFGKTFLAFVEEFGRFRDSGGHEHVPHPGTSPGLRDGSR